MRDKDDKAFKFVVWSAGYVRTEQVVYAPSYDSAHYRYVTMSMFPHGTIAGVEPIDEDELR